jgi:aspartate-semialdehyde dehydrogenase
MVGSVLMQRMQQEGDFAHIQPKFFSTSQVGGAAPAGALPLANASDLDALGECAVVLSCQGGEWTSATHPRLRQAGWRGYWIDAASSLRMHNDAVIVLDPVNGALIERALDRGVRDFIGGNCTVSLMMLALGGLLREDLVEWVSAMTYQAASGAGAQNMRELLAQMGVAHQAAAALLDDPQAPILAIDERVSQALRSAHLPREHFGVALAGSLIPWIAEDLGNGISKEEWKGDAECNKILGRALGASNRIPVESLCVRIGAMRCHAQALTIKLRRDLSLADIESLLATGNDWVKLIPNTREASVAALSPVNVAGTLDIVVGRVRKLALGAGFISAFTVGDQLLWGAAEPLRRMLRILLPRLAQV